MFILNFILACLVLSFGPYLFRMAGMLLMFPLDWLLSSVNLFGYKDLIDKRDLEEANECRLADEKYMIEVLGYPPSYLKDKFS